MNYWTELEKLIWWHFLWCDSVFITFAFYLCSEIRETHSLLFSRFSKTVLLCVRITLVKRIFLLVEFLLKCFQAIDAAEHCWSLFKETEFTCLWLQDTVMALQALGAYSEKAYSPTFNISVTVTSAASSQQFEVTPENAIVLQSYEVSLAFLITSFWSHHFYWLVL